MSIKSFFGKTVIVLRLKAVSGNRRSMTTTATVDGAIQEMDKQSRTEIGLVQDRAWQAYFDITDENNVKEGDLIVDEDGMRYKVSEVTKKDYGINQHLDVILIEYSDG